MPTDEWIAEVHEIARRVVADAQPTRIWWCPACGAFAVECDGRSHICGVCDWSENRHPGGVRW